MHSWQLRYGVSNFKSKGKKIKVCIGKLKKIWLNIRHFFILAQISKIKVLNHYPEHLLFRWIVLTIVIWHLFWRFNPKRGLFWGYWLSHLYHTENLKLNNLKHIFFNVICFPGPVFSLLFISIALPWIKLDTL